MNNNKKKETKKNRMKEMEDKTCQKNKKLRFPKVKNKEKKEKKYKIIIILHS